MVDIDDESTLAQAYRLVHGERQRTYGPPSQSFARTADMINAILGGHSCMARHVPLILIGLKLVREGHAHQDDNLVDIAGYAEALMVALRADD